MTEKCKYPEREQFAKNLRAALQKAGKSQADLASFMGCKNHTIYFFTRAKGLPKSYAGIKIIAKFLGVKPNALMSFKKFEQHHERIHMARVEAQRNRVIVKVNTASRNAPKKPKLNLAELDNANNYLERAKQQISHRIKAMRLCEKPKGALDLRIVLGRF